MSKRKCWLVIFLNALGQIGIGIMYLLIIFLSPQESLKVLFFILIVGFEIYKVHDMYKKCKIQRARWANVIIGILFIIMATIILFIA